MDQWVGRLRQQGILLDGLTTRYGRSEKALADALAFSINYSGESLTPTELMDRMEELRSYTIYRQNTRFAPLDIESTEELEKYLEDLVSNGFLEKEGGRFSVVSTPTEDRIIRVLENRPLSPDVLRRRFVIFSSNKAIVDQVYLPTLERKGLITVGDEVALQDSSVTLQSAKEAFQKYDTNISGLKGTTWWSYASLCVSKKHDDRVISIQDFDFFIRKLYTMLQQGDTNRSWPLILQRCHLISTLLLHFDQALAKKVTAARVKGESYVSKANRRLDDVRRKVSLLVQEYNRYCAGQTYTDDSMEELASIDALYDRMTSIDQTTFSKDALKAELGDLRKRVHGGESPHFFFGHESEDADYFSLKVKKLRENFERFENQASAAESDCDRISKRIEDIERERVKPKGRLATYRVDQSHLIAFAFLRRIIDYHELPLEAELSTGLTLQILSQFFDRVYRTIAELGGKIDEAIDRLDDILDDEKTIEASLEALDKRANSMKAFFDVNDDSSAEALALVTSFAEVRNMYGARSRTSVAQIEAAKNADELIEPGRKITRLLRDVDRKLTPIGAGLENMRIKCTNSLEEYSDNASKVINVLEAANAPVSPLRTILETIVSAAGKQIDNVFGGKASSVRWGKIWEELDSFRDRLYEESRKILESQLEFKVLYSVVSGAKKGPWLRTDDVIEIISKEHTVEKLEVRQAIQSLLQKGLLKEGVSLAM